MISAFQTLKQEHFLTESLLVCMDCHLNVHVSVQCHHGKVSVSLTTGCFGMEAKLD